MTGTFVKSFGNDIAKAKFGSDIAKARFGNDIAKARFGNDIAKARFGNDIAKASSSSLKTRACKKARPRDLKAYDLEMTLPKLALELSLIHI